MQIMWVPRIVDRITIISLLVLSSFIGRSQLVDSSCIFKEGSQLKCIANTFSFTEGPAVDRFGNIYFTDQPNDAIWKYSVSGKLSLFLSKTGRSNGLFIDKKGNILACADENNQLWSITPHKKITILVKDLGGKQLNGPNDLWLDKSGGIYFTDPYYQRSYWSRKSPEINGEKVYYFNPENKRFVVLDSLLKKPNGIVGTPDGKYLYVSDIGAGKTYKYEIEKSGKLKNKLFFCSQGSDGMTLDNKGNVYLTGDGVTIYNLLGKKIGHLPVSKNWTGNVCFGGRDKSMLFITASEAVYSIPTNVKGVE